MISGDKQRKMKGNNNLLISKSKYGARRSIMAQQNSHETRSSEDNRRCSKSIRYHGCMVCKHLAHVVLHNQNE